MLNSIEKDRFYISEQYIQASKNMIDGMLKTKNSLVIISDHRISNEELVDSLKYSSGSIILPALFCLYQGIELLLKGFVMHKAHKKSCHKTEELCNDFSEFYKDEEELTSLLRKLIFSPEPFIKQYMDVNNLDSIELFYNSLRYPDSKGSGLTDYFILKYPNHEDFLQQLNNIKNDINQLLPLSVKLFRALDAYK